jgi:hypothetical protein
LQQQTATRLGCSNREAAAPHAARSGGPAGGWRASRSVRGVTTSGFDPHADADRSCAQPPAVEMMRTRSLVSCLLTLSARPALSAPTPRAGSP